MHVLVGTADVAALACVHQIGLSSSCDFALAANHGYGGVVSVFVHIHAESACFADGEREIRGVNFVGIALAQFADAEIYVAFGQPHLNHILIEIEEKESGHAAEVNGGLSSLKFSTRILVGPKLVTDGDRAVLGSGTPIACAAGL